MGHNSGKAGARMSKKTSPKSSSKRRKYAKPSVTKHGALPQTALAHSY